MTAAQSHEGGAQGPEGIANFAWVEAGRVARGEQPLLVLSAYQELRDRGFSTVLSLRAEREYLDDDRRRYDVREERALCEAAGLRLLHVDCTDFQAPEPDAVVRALAILHDEVEQDRAIFVHCLAGVGRTGVVCGAWQLLRGACRSDALRQFGYFVEESRTRRAAHRAPDEYVDRIGAHYQAWVLTTIAKALKADVEQGAETPSGRVRPRRPANAKGWGRRFRDELQRYPALVHKPA